MPVATPDQYADMLDRAKAGGFAYPAINVSSSQTINAVLQGLTEAGSDGILQVTTGGADYFAGHTVKARSTGALAFAKYVHEVAKNYPITVALHTDHCPKPALEDFVLPLIGQNILQSLGMTINSIVVGQMLGTGALAAVATFMPLAFFFIAFWRSPDPFMAAHWGEIAIVDYCFKVLISIVFFLPMYGMLLNMLLKRLADKSEITALQAG